VIYEKKPGHFLKSSSSSNISGFVQHFFHSCLVGFDLLWHILMLSETSLHSDALCARKSETKPAQYPADSTELDEYVPKLPSENGIGSLVAEKDQK
jgi:hypothetical protein